MTLDLSYYWEGEREKGKDNNWDVKKKVPVQVAVVVVAIV